MLAKPVRTPCHAFVPVKESVMREFLLGTALVVVTALGSSAPANAQENADQKLGAVHFATSCHDPAQRLYDGALRYHRAFWYAESKQICQDAHKAHPECAI